MKLVFVDTVYWLAIFIPGDAYAEAAQAVDFSGAEFLAAVSARGQRTRQLACGLVREIMNDSGIVVAVQSHDSFLAGLALYERRADKQYSLADCISMNVMRQQHIQHVLTNDRHFAQEGFKRLLD